MTGKYSISSGSLIQIMRYLDSIGIDSNAFMDGVSLSHEMLSNPDTRIPIEKYIEVEKMAARVSGDPFFGLHMGQFAEAGGWSIVGYMMMNCRTVLEGFAKFAKYSDAVNEWGLIIDLSPASEQPGLRGKRATSRFQAGAYSEAMAEFDELTKLPDWTVDQWYSFATVYAVASDKIADKKKEYADRAMVLLHKAVAAGFDQAASMAKDTNLDSLRDREDFKKLVDSLPKSPAPAKP
jgi:hypothetical protein